MRSKGHSLIWCTEGPSKTQNFTPNIPSSSCQKTKKYWKGLYNFLLIGTRFCKNFWKLSSLITFSSAVTQNYQAFKVFYVDPKVPNSAKQVDHKILDGCPWNVWCDSNSLGQGGCCWTAQKLIIGMSWVYPDGVLILHRYIFIIFHMWLTSPPRSTLFLLDTDTPGASTWEMMSI